MPNITIPSKYICPRTQKIMREPMLAHDGVSYEREAITTGLDDYPIDSGIVIPVSLRNTLPNLSLKEEISQFLHAYPELSASDAVYLPGRWIFALIEAIFLRDLQKTTNLIKLDRRLLSYQIYEDYTPFHYACEFGNFTTTRYLFNCFNGHYEDLIQLPRPHHWQPKHLNDLLADAFLTTGFDAIDNLLILGADPEKAYSQLSAKVEAEQWSPLHELSPYLLSAANSPTVFEPDDTASRIDTADFPLPIQSINSQQQEANNVDSSNQISEMLNLIKHQKNIIKKKDILADEISTQNQYINQINKNLVQENRQLKRKAEQLEAELANNNNTPIVNAASTQAGFFKPEKRAKNASSLAMPKQMPAPAFHETLA